ncbi:MAG TPA: hypothetical protein VN366_02510 [Feifaniaceae bacterium]|nr:hypothetical protein [Feifaniaceae bacterium]
MPEKIVKQPGRQEEMPDETLEKVSGGWIIKGDRAYACQLFTDDVLLRHLYEVPNTCPEFRSRKKDVAPDCKRCISFLDESN